MAAQYSFLKLAPHAPIFTHFPAATAHVLKVSRREGVGVSSWLDARFSLHC